MAEDILLTPEEQDERARQWLKDNGLALLLGVGLGLGAVFGYQSWQTKLQTDAEAASALFNQVLSSVQLSELADIEAKVNQIKTDYPSSPYAVKASLLHSRQLSVSDLAAAEEELQWAVGNAKESGLLHTAKIRQAKVLVALGKLAEAKVLANQAEQGGFASNYAEILGDIAVLEKDISTARTQYEAAIESLPQQELGYASILNLKLNRLPFDSSAEEVAAPSVDQVDASDMTTSEENAEVDQSETE